jgi:hypothetical protein
MIKLKKKIRKNKIELMNDKIIKKTQNSIQIILMSSVTRVWVRYISKPFSVLLIIRMNR